MSDLLTILSGLGKGYMSGQQYKQKQDLLTADREAKRAAAAADAEYKRQRLKLEQDKIDADRRKGFEDTELGQFKDALGSFDTQMSGFTSNVLKGKTKKERESIARGEIGNILTRWNTLKNWYGTPTISRRFPATPFDTFAKTRLGAPTWLTDVLSSSNTGQLDLSGIPIPELTPEDINKMYSDLSNTFASDVAYAKNPEMAAKLAAPLYSALRESGMTDEQIQRTYPNALAGRLYEIPAMIPDTGNMTSERLDLKGPALSDFTVGGKPLGFFNEPEVSLPSGGVSTFRRLLPTQLASDPFNAVSSRLNTDMIGGVPEVTLAPNYKSFPADDDRRFIPTGRQTPVGSMNDFLRNVYSPNIVDVVPNIVDVVMRGDLNSRKKAIDAQKSFVSMLDDPAVLAAAGANSVNDYTNPDIFKSAVQKILSMEPNFYRMPGIKEMLDEFGTGPVEKRTAQLKPGLRVAQGTVPVSAKAEREEAAGRAGLAKTEVETAREQLQLDIDRATKAATIEDKQLAPMLKKVSIWATRAGVWNAQRKMDFDKKVTEWEQGFKLGQRGEDRLKSIGQFTAGLTDDTRARLKDIDTSLGYARNNLNTTLKTALLVGLPDDKSRALFEKIEQGAIAPGSPEYKEFQDTVRNNPQRQASYDAYLKGKQTVQNLEVEKTKAQKDFKTATEAQRALLSAGAVGGASIDIEELAATTRRKDDKLGVTPPGLKDKSKPNTPSGNNKPTGQKNKQDGGGFDVMKFLNVQRQK